jgi:single-stranded DNA-binding protein
MANIITQPEARDVGESQVCNFRVVFNKYTKKGQEPDKTYLDCTLWGPRSAFLSEIVVPGAEIYIEGFLRQRSFEHEGKKRTKHELLVQNFFVPRGSKNHNQNNSEESEPVSASTDFDDNMPF